QRCVVDDDDGEGDFALVLAAEAIAAGRRLFGRAAYGAVDSESQRRGVEVGAVVEQDVRASLDDLVDIAQGFLARAHPPAGKNPPAPRPPPPPRRRLGGSRPPPSRRSPPPPPQASRQA